MSTEEDPERQPLLEKKNEQPTPTQSLKAASIVSLGSTGPRRTGSSGPRFRNLFSKDHDVVDVMTYKAEVLTTWAVFSMHGVRTAWQKSTTWLMMLRLFFVSLIAAALVIIIVPDPARLRSSKFVSISVFLRVFVGLLLGFFLSSSVNRWYACTGGFLELFDAVRNLQMQFFALGAPSDRRFQCIRYGVLSGHLLSMELKIEMLPEEERLAATMKMWKDLEVDELDSVRSYEGADGPPRYLALSREESNLLQTVDEPAGMPWVWVASLVGRMAQDGNIPPMASPTYGRIMNLAQNAHGGIRKVKQSITVQAPFIYMHMLATLVHINNIVNAIGFGITLGSIVGVMVGRFQPGLVYEKDEKPGHKDLLRDTENIIVMFFISMVGPLLYQALLDVSVCIAQPFACKEGAIPVSRLLESLERDLRDATRMARDPPGWEPPKYMDSVAKK